MEERLDRRGGPPPTRVSGGTVRPLASRRPAAPRPANDPRLAALPRDVTALPELPAPYGFALQDGLRQLGMELPLEALRRIRDHVRLLLAWNESINLTAIRDPAVVATRHVLDSLTAVPLLRAAGTASGRILDIGSGGGFPGLVLAAALPGARVELAEAATRKAAFLEAAIEATGLAARVTVRPVRAETLARTGPPAPPGRDVVTARAVAGLAELVELALPCLELGGRLVAWKRGDLAAELDAAARAARALGGTDPIVHPIPPLPDLAGHVLVEVRKASPSPAGFPRDPAVRRRRPW